MRLFIVRHSKAEELHLQLNDSARNLTKEGLRRAAALCERLIKRGWVPTKIFSSPFNRALQTSEILRDGSAAGVEISVLDELVPEMNLMLSLKPQLEPLSRSSEQVMIVTHQPALGVLIDDLLGEEAQRVESLSPATLVCVDISKWQKDSGRLVGAIYGNEL